MAMSKAKTPADYLAELPAERRGIVSKVRDVVRKHLPKGYKETMNWGMITYELPLTDYPDTYNGQPLCYAGLAAQKNHYSLYLMEAYIDPAQVRRLKDAYSKAGKRLDMGKSCLRFQRVDDLPLDVIGSIIASTPPKKLTELYARTRGKSARKSAGRSASKRKSKRASTPGTARRRKR